MQGPVALADIGDCTSNKYCLYRDAAYLGGSVNSSGYINNLGNLNFNDRASAIINARAYRVFFYVNSNQL